MAAKKKKSDKTVKKNIAKQIDEKEFFSVKEVLVITILAIIFGWFMGSIVANKTEDINDSSDIKNFRSVYNNIVSNYYKKVDKTKLIEASIDGMLEYLDDPYTTYMTKQQTASFNQIMSGEYKGIGVSIIKYKDEIIVFGVFKNSPAAKAGIKAGDVILEIDKKPMNDKEIDDVIEMVKDKKEVNIKIKRKKEEKSLMVKPTKVELPSVASKVLEKNDKKVGYIEISIFASNTSKQFKKELLELEKKNIDSYIIDLRGNSGGYLAEAVNILSEFMDKSKVIYQIKTKNRTIKYYSQGKKDKKYKVSVLIDENSASASEIVAAAFKESYNADIVGKKTYGKGTVQQSVKLEDGASMKYTIESWLTPSGKFINKNGIEPNVEVDLNEDYFDEPSFENDNQLQTALDRITKSN